MTTDTYPTAALPVSALSADVVAHVASTATLHEVADALAAGDIGALAVGEPGAVIGIISERDLVHALASRRDPATTTAADMANAGIIWCDAEATVTEVAEVMMTRYVRHVLLESDGHLVGIVSARDLLGAYAAADLGA